MSPMTRNSIVELFQKLMHNRNLGLILISHDEEVIRSLADEILVFSEGRIVEKGRTEKLIKEPKHPVTQKIFSAQSALTGKPIS